MTRQGFTDRAGVDAPGAASRKVTVVGWMIDNTRPKSVLIASFDRTLSVTLPRAQIAIETGMPGPTSGRRSRSGGQIGDQVRVTMPAWLARDRNLTTETDERQRRLF